MDPPYYVSDYEVMGSKFIGVAENGSLELHGQEVTSWTKLIQTARPMDLLDNAIVYQYNVNDQFVLFCNKENKHYQKSCYLLTANKNI